MLRIPAQRDDIRRTYTYDQILIRSHADHT